MRSSGSVSPVAASEDCGRGILCEESTIAPAPKAIASPLTLVANSETPQKGLKPGFGIMPRPTKFGLRGKRTLIRAGGAIDKTQAGKPQILITLTLPGSTVQAMAALAAWSSYVVDRLKTWIHDHSPTSLSMYSWEWQRRGALHIHYVHVCNNMNEVKYIKRHVRTQWYKMLENICVKSGVDVFERSSGGTWFGLPKMLQCDVTLVQRTVAGYIAKYIGKGCTAASEKHFAPTRWWGVSRNLLGILKEHTYTYKKEFLSFLEARKWMNKWYNASLDLAHKRYTYVHKAGGGETFICFAHSDEMEQICKELPMLNGSSTQANQHSSMIQSMELFRRVLTHTEATFMKLSPPHLSEAYLKEVELLCCRDMSELRLSVPVLCNLLCWSATLSSALQFSQQARRLRRILQSSENNLLITLMSFGPSPVTLFVKNKLEASGLTNSDQACKAGTSRQSDGGSDIALATKDTIPQRRASYTQMSLM